MSNTNETKLTFHRRTFFELTTPERTLFIDPVFSHKRRGRRVADKVRACDYVLSTSMTLWFDDVLDVLEDCDATYVSTPQLRRYVARELGLTRSRLLDLEPWERASEEGLRITALPITASIGMEKAIGDGTSILRDIQGVFPRGSMRIPLLDGALPMFDSGLNTFTRMLGNIGTVQRPRSMDRVGDMFGVDLGEITGGRPGIGFIVEIEGFRSVMHLADGVHEGTSEDDFDDIADVCEPDVLILHATGMDVGPVVRAARALNPKTVLLYRARDPYRAGRRTQTLPITSFIGAVEEGASGCEALQLADGDTYVLEAKKAAKKATKSAPFKSPLGKSKSSSTSSG